MRSGDRFEYRALPSQLKSLLSQLEPHDLCDFPNAHIVRKYLQPLEFLPLQWQFCPKFAFHSFMSADAGADAPTAQQSSFASCERVALDMGAYSRSREALLRWSMSDTKALAHYAERSFGWQQVKLESVLHPDLWRVREWRERGLMGRGQMRERTDDVNANSGAPLTQLSITAFATHVQTPCSTSKNALYSTTN